MDNLETEFPKSQNKFIKASQFQDQEIPVTFLGWRKKANQDLMKDEALVKSWKQRLKFCLKYSYPEFAVDEAGEKIMKNGAPLPNRNYDPKFPQGYSVLYVFEEGMLESGSVPLFNAFCFVRPQKGDKLLIKRTGEKTETEWTIKKAQHSQATVREESEEIINDDFSESDGAPF